MTTDANNPQPPEESSQPSVPMLNPPFTTQRRPERMTQKPKPILFEPLAQHLERQPDLPRHPSHQALLDLMKMPMETRYMALDVSASTFGMPSADRDGAIESLYEKMGYDGSDTYTGTIVIIEVAGNPFLVRSLASLFFNAGYLRLQSYRPDPKAARADQLAADIDESERKH